MSLISVDQVPDAATLLDVRWELGGPPGRDLYLEGHIPGAVFVDLDAALAGPPGAGGRHPLPSIGAFGDAIRAAGVSRSRPVVVYDAGNSVAAARAWWLLRYFGHPDVQVLDGGFAAWRAAGLPIEREVPEVQPGDFEPRAGGMPLLDAGGAAVVARDGVLLDARAPERFRGEIEPVDPVAGHIPGAVNVPATSLVDRDGRFRDADALRRLFEDAGVRAGPVVGSPAPAGAIGAYCGSGVAASHQVLALSLAGIPAALYVGSWSDWITDPARPVARGE